MFVKKIPGLTPTGVLLPTSDDYGYIVFQRSNCCADESRHRYYNEEVLKTFVNCNINAKRLLRHIPMDAPRTINETVCSWRDGDVPQINSLVKSGELLSSEKTNIRYLKQSASRSKGEQAADMSPIFKIIHNLNKKFTSQDKPTNHLQLIVENELKSDPRLSIKTDHVKALVDFVSQIGSIMNSAATPHNLKKGFIANGMIDIGSETCPDIDVMLGTLTRELTEHEYDLVQNNFNELLHIQMREGHISDKVYDRIGFPNDVNCGGANRE
jgi:hypothetical protein